jgi:hypothetical protein
MSRMSVPASLDSDPADLIHPLHHPSAYASTRICVSGDGALIKDILREAIPPVLDAVRKESAVSVGS